VAVVVAVMGGRLRQQCGGLSSAVCGSWERIQLGLHLGDSVRLNLKGDSQVGHLERLLLKVRIELLKCGRRKSRQWCPPILLLRARPGMDRRSEKSDQSNGWAVVGLFPFAHLRVATAVGVVNRMMTLGNDD
jgi:hypothetical protein